MLGQFDVIVKVFGLRKGVANLVDWLHTTHPPYAEK